MNLGDIRKVVVVGAGTMGHSIAQVFAQGDYQVSLVDKSESILKRAMEVITANLKTLSENGLVRTSEIAAIRKRITPTLSLKEGSEGADLAVEAVFENIDLKKSIFADLDQFCPRQTILTSNTSSLNIYDIVETSRPDKVVIAHWFAPPHIIPLVEVVKGEKTSSETIDLVMAMLRKVGKGPVFIKQFMPGFIINRLQFVISDSMFEMLDNGWASPEDIDVAVKASLGIRLPIVGVAQTCDFSGLDLVKAINDLRGKASRAVDEKVKKGHLGAKTGKGIFDYGGRTLEEIFKRRDERYLKMMKYLEEINAYEPI